MERNIYADLLKRLGMQMLASDKDGLSRNAEGFLLFASRISELV
jgi:hypothetical protein